MTESRSATLPDVGDLPVVAARGHRPAATGWRPLSAPAAMTASDAEATTRFVKVAGVRCGGAAMRR